MSNNADVHNVIEALRPKLREYITKYGKPIGNTSERITASGFCRCLHPDHTDNHPSCSIGGGLDEKVFNCFSQSGHSGNIFTAAHYLQGLPVNGEEFYTITLKTLTSEFGIPYEPAVISPDHKREYQHRMAYHDALSVLKSLTYDSVSGSRVLKNHSAIKFLMDRGISEEAIRRFDICCISSYDAYLKAMEKLGWTSKTYLDEVGLTNKGIFNNYSVIIPINDDRGRVCGFVSRNTRHDSSNSDSIKFINTNNNSIYTKGKILYNFNSAKKEEGPLFIVEGYLDAVYLSQMGLKKVVALGSTVLTEQHINMLMEYGCKDIVLVYDADEGGLKGIGLALDRLSETKAFRVGIVDLPVSYDPDTYVREHGLTAFQELPRATSFKWSLTHSTYDVDLFTVAQRAIPTIAIEDSHLTRLKMVKELSDHTGIAEADLKRDVENLLNKKEDKYVEEIKRVNSLVQFKLNKKDALSTRAIVRDAIAELDRIEEKYNKEINLSNDFLTRFETFEDRLKRGDFKYGLVAPNFKMLEKTLDGIPHWSKIMLFAGRPSMGKTALLTALVLDVIDNNPDAAVFYQSIDDNIDFMSEKIIAVRSGVSTSEIKQYASLKGEKKDRVEDAIRWIKSVSNRFIIADATQGNNLDSIDNHMRNFTKALPDHKKIYLLDNFHKLKMAQSTDKKADSISDSISTIKELSLIYDMPVLATVELRKLETESSRPTRQDMQGSNKLDYDADVVVLIHTDKKVNSESPIVYNRVVNGENVEMPYTEAHVAKNKINGKEARIPYRFNSYNMQFDESDYSEWNEKYTLSKKRVTSRVATGMMKNY